MEFQITSVKFRKYPVAFKEFRQSPNQDIGRYIYSLGLELYYLAKADVPKRTGHLAQSIDVNYSRGRVDPSVTIAAKARYAYYVHEGTLPHVIRAKTGRSLRFVYNGRVVYARKVNHPGAMPDRFLSRHLRQVVH